MGIETMSVRGVMISETSGSPSSMTPSIISRASSSRSPSRCPSVTIVRISSSNDSSSGASGMRPARRWSSGSTNRAPKIRGKRAKRSPPQRPGVIEERRGPQPGDGPGNPDLGGQTAPTDPTGHAEDQQQHARRPGGVPLGPDPERAGADEDGRGDDLERLGGQADVLVAAEDLAEPLGRFAAAADFLQFVARELGQRLGPDRRQAGNAQPGDRQPEHQVGTHAISFPALAFLGFAVGLPRPACADPQVSPPTCGSVRPGRIEPSTPAPACASRLRIRGVVSS